MPASTFGEFVGTTVLVLLGNGVVANVVLVRSKGEGGGWITITTGWAIAVFFGALTAMALGAPGELNPAATLANVLRGSRTPFDAVCHAGAQLLGAMLGATLVWLHYLPHWSATRDPEAIRAAFCTAPAIPHRGANLLSEALGTATLIFVASAAASVSPSGGAPVSAALVLALVWGIGLSLGGSTGYAINPARDLGPRLAHALLPIANKGHSDWRYAWIPVVGPCLGAGAAALLWQAAR